MFKFLVFLTIAISSVYSYDASPAITTQHQNTLRSYGNLGQVSTFSKTLDTPFSSVRKSDVRISNPGLTIATPFTGYSGHPGYAGGLPFVHQAPAYPIAPAAPFPGYHHGPAIVASGPAYHAPVYHAPAYNGPAYHSPIGLAKTVVPGAGLLGVAYSPAPAVSHMTFSNGLGLNYAW